MNEQWREGWNLHSSDLLPSSLSFLWKAFSFQKDNALVHSLRSITYFTPQREDIRHGRPQIATSSIIKPNSGETQVHFSLQGKKGFHSSVLPRLIPCLRSCPHSLLPSADHSSGCEPLSCSYVVQFPFLSTSSACRPGEPPPSWDGSRSGGVG